MMVNNSTNTNKANYHLSPSITEHKQTDHVIWRSQCRSWHVAGTTMWWS